jgi:hypothetical protein
LLRGRETLNRPVPARLAATVDQNWAKNLDEEGGLVYKQVEIGEAKRKFRLKAVRPALLQDGHGASLKDRSGLVLMRGAT